MMSFSRLFLFVILTISIFPFLIDHVAGNIVDGGKCRTWCKGKICSNNCDISACECTDELTPEQKAKKIGTIVGIVIGCIAGVALLTVGLCFAYHYRKFCFSHIAFAKVTTTHTIYNSADPSQNATITTEREIRPGMVGYPYWAGGGVTTVATVHSEITERREIIHETGPTDVPPADAPPAYHDGNTQPPGYAPIQPPSYAPTLMTSHPTSTPQLPPQSHVPQLQPQTHIPAQTHQPTLYNQPSYAQPSYAQHTYAQPQGYAQPSYVPQYGAPQAYNQPPQGYHSYMSNPAIQAPYQQSQPYQQSAPVEFEPVIKPGRKASGYVPVE